MSGETIVVIMYILINLIGFFYMKVDKNRAIHHRWRVPENRLMFIAMVGGGLGATIGMNMFKHKTKHPKFKWGLPFFTVINLILYGYLYHFVHTINL